MRETEQTTRLSFRLPANVKERIAQAAMISGVSLTDFAISNLSESADDVLELHQFRILTNRDRDIFLRMLDSENLPNDKLIEAFRSRKELISE